MAWTTATFDEVLDDLSSRFIINVPDEELASVERICFQIEQAHWFYEDFVREQNPALPSFNLKNFCAKFFQHCPLLHEWSNEHETAFANFMEYKIRVPVCGAIILNEAMDKCILVKGWTARSGWGFPKGKINKDEPDTLCAVREVWEETGYDVADRIRDEDFVEQTIKDQRIRLYIIKGVPEDTVFEPQTRKEISKIEWHYIAELPASRPKPSDKGTHSGKESGTERASGKGSSRYYMVTPFVHKLKSWIVAQRRNNKRNKGQNAQSHNHGENHATNAASRHSNGHQHQAAAPTISSAEARLDSEVLKNMLGIGKGASSSQDSVPSAQRQTSSSYEMSPPLSDNMNSSESLKALLGIQSSSSGNNNNNSFAREGMATGSPTIQPASTTSSHSTRPVSTPASSSSASYQNGSEALKAMLGIPSQPNSPASRFNHIANGASPVMSNAGVIPNGQGQYRPDFSPQIHHSSATNSPMNARNGSVDLLALLKGGNGNGHGDGHRNSGLGNGTPAKPKNMTNFTFDVEALY
ncbi:mRNA-decapping enzyme subunit 2 [Mortierella sp. AD011]|nr:mRNA-decapping enzyme subunit 2 [Mortierella sp. AD010]KAF9391110.1 mRNA-decapping enzyme subunit 2 [Mortierella sp. AD011]